MKKPSPALLTAGVAVLAAAIARTADGYLEAQPLAGIMVSVVLIDLLVSRVGGELPTERTLLARLQRALPWVALGLAPAAVIVVAALIVGHGRVAGAAFDVPSIGLGLVRALGTVARRQLPFVVLPLALLGAKLDPRALVAFAALASAATVIRSGDGWLSVFVHLAAGAWGGAVLLKTRDFVVSLLAEATVFFAIGTLFASVIDLRLGAWSLAPLERAQGPYAVALGLVLLGLAVAVLAKSTPAPLLKEDR